MTFSIRTASVRSRRVALLGGVAGLALASVAALDVDPGRVLGTTTPKVETVDLATWVESNRAADGDFVEPEPVDPPAADPVAAPAPEPEPVRSHWDALADCESGEWNGQGVPLEGTANWSTTAGFFEGGLQFHPNTWDGFRDADMPANAYDASREVQIEVGERVLAAQGWGAWPVCSVKVGLR